ncbi:MAG: hypothetical protein PWQ18_311, partial [Clostridia bacterium]|nr:hypothetical protein [Clostridia bacterium]
MPDKGNLGFCREEGVAFFWPSLRLHIYHVSDNENLLTAGGRVWYTMFAIVEGCPRG